MAADADLTVDLDVDAKPELVDDEQGLALLLRDTRGVVVRVNLERHADAWIDVRGLARRIESMDLPVKMATVGYLPEHGAHTGPGVFRPVFRPVEQDPFGGPSSGAH